MTNIETEHRKGWFINEKHSIQGQILAAIESSVIKGFPYSNQTETSIGVIYIWPKIFVLINYTNLSKFL